MPNRPIRIGTRGSALALWQANHVKDQLTQAGYDVSIEVIKTKGDQIQHLGFDKIEGKGFFTKEIEEALLSDRVDLAVHSLKDLETTQPNGLCLASVSERESPFDVLLIKPGSLDESEVFSLKQRARVGTSSARRKSWLKHARPDLITEDIRGNVPTRINKLRNGELDAIVLADAGLTRLQIDLEGLVKKILPVQEFVPAPAQGVLGLQTRSNDLTTLEAAQAFGSAAQRIITDVERGVLKGIGGGCHVPLGAYCQQLPNGQYQLRANYDFEGELRTCTLEGKPDQLMDRALAILKKKSSSHVN